MSTIGNQLVQNQQMTLTPKMIEELKILQMSSIDLMQYIEEVLVENPLLEVDRTDDLIDTLMSETSEYRENGDYYSNDDGNSEKDFAEYTPAFTSLKQYLLSQLGELDIDLQHRKIAEYIVHAIDDDGFFRESIYEVALKLKIPVQKVKEALKIVQELEPAGIGARNIKECILLQLKRKNLLDATVKSVVKDYLELLGDRKYKEIAKKLDISIEQVMSVHKIIKVLNPKPGLQFLDFNTSYIVPELLVKEINGKYTTVFYDERIPTLRINDLYKSLMKNEECSSETNKYIKSKILKAVEIINAIEQRKKTILSTADFIAQYQGDFFRKGYSYLKPMTMKRVADEIGLHESTISRTVNNKYIQTPRGVFELKYFFSAGIEADGGNSISANSIKDAIRKIVSEEDKSKPFSDEYIRKILEEKAIKVARRTVAKYREEISILPARMRKD